MRRYYGWLKIASHLHMSVYRCRQEIRTHREYRTWLRFLQDEQNVPSRSDWYLMQLTDAVFSLPSLVWGKRPKKISLRWFRIWFGSNKPKPMLTKDKAIKLAQARWFGITGYKRKNQDHVE